MMTTEALRNLFNAIDKYPDRLVCAVVHLNDTYLIEEQQARSLPGFPRLIALVKALRDHIQLATHEDRLVVVHSGDFLGPSRLGKADKGAAMIDMLNRLQLQYFVAGNHEFDYGASNFEDQLLTASFELVCCNARAPLTVNNFSECALWPPQGPPVVAFTGVVSESVHNSFKGWPPFSNPGPALKAFCANTKHVPFHVVLSHATRVEDRAMRPSLDDCSRTVLLGGHDHHIDWREGDVEPVLYKNRSNLQSVRVFLLLAGGGEALNQLGWRYLELKKQNGGPPRYNATFVDALLKPLHPSDARIFRDWIDADDRKREDTVARMRADTSLRAPKPTETYVWDDDDDLPDDALAHRLAGLPNLYDWWSHVLRSEDLLFFPADPAAEREVTARLQSITRPNEDDVICDFSTSTRQLDARDSQLRTGPTDFGLLVAECVRRQGKADIAIVNSGAFRCDTLFDPKVTRRILLDTFLYDEPGADEPIMILTLDNEDIDILLAHGRSRATSGAFPQVSDHRNPSQSRHVVAISSYPLIDVRSPDEYVEVYAKSKGVSEAQARADFRAAREGQFRIIPAIEQHLGHVSYQAPKRDELEQDDAKRFVNLARAVRTEFERVFDYGKTTHVNWNNTLRGVLSGQRAVRDAALASAQKALRDFLMRDEIRLGDVDALYAGIKAHEANFEDDVEYTLYFRAAASTIPGINLWGGGVNKYYPDGDTLVEGGRWWKWWPGGLFGINRIRRWLMRG